MLIIDRSTPVVNPVEIRGTVKNKTFKEISKALAACIQNKQEYLILDINSPGGEAYSALAIMEMMRAEKTVKIVTIVSGFAASAAAMIFACGTKGYRFMNPNATLLFHSVQTEIGHVNVAEFQQEWSEVQALNNALCELASVDAKTNTVVKDLITDTQVDRYIGASKCCELGLCDYMHMPVVEKHGFMTVSTRTEVIDSGSPEQFITPDPSRAKSSSSEAKLRRRRHNQKNMSVRKGSVSKARKVRVVEYPQKLK